MALVAVSVFEDLDVRAARWLPQLDERVTHWHLLTHRSGLFDYMWDGETYEQLAFGPPALSDPDTFLGAALSYPFAELRRARVLELQLRRDRPHPRTRDRPPAW